MKPIMYLFIFCLLLILMLSGCGKSDEKFKNLGVLNSEVFQLQQQFRPLISELSKFAMQIETLSNRKDPIVAVMANEIDSVHKQIAIAFKITDGWQIPPRDDIDGMIKVLEFDRDLLKMFIGQASVAIKKSNDIIEAVNKMDAKKSNLKKKL